MADGVIIGTRRAFATRAPTIDRDDDTSPRSATTLSRSMSWMTLLFASFGFVLSSS